MGRRVSCPQFVGRREELAVLDSSFADAAGGVASTVFIAGDAGIGKSRLVEEWSARARQQGALVATGLCAPADGGGLPYAPIVGVLRSLAREVGETAAAEIFVPMADGLGPLLPAVAGGTGRPAADTAPDGVSKTRLFESVLAAITAVAKRTTAVLVLEDLHWADSGSAELVDFLARNLTETRVFLVGTFRSDEPDRQRPFPRLLAELERQRHVTRLEVSPLSREEIAAMVGGILNHRPDWTLAEAICARSEGNPFFVEELTAARGAVSLPAGLTGLIMSQVAVLSAEAQRVLKLAAAAGPSIDHRLLTAATGIEADSLDRLAYQLVDSQLLVVEPGDSHYRFRHALVREAVYESLLPGERGRLHRQLAGTLAAHPDLLPSDRRHAAIELAEQWWAAGEWSQALDASLAAADAATTFLAFPESLRYLEHALAAWDRAPDAATGRDVSRLDLLERAADVAYLAGENQRSVELAQAALDGVDATGDPRRAALSYTRLGRNAWAVNDSAAAFSAYRQAAALLPSEQPSVELARILAEHGRGLMLTSRFRDAEQRCRDAIAMARAVGARAEEGHATNTLGVCVAAMGRPDEGLGLLRDALAIATEVGDPDDLNRAYSNLVQTLFDTGRLEEAVEVAREVRASGVLGSGVVNTELNGAEALLRLGRWNESQEALMGFTSGVGVCQVGRALLLALLRIRGGSLAEADPLLASAEEATNGLNDVQTRGWFHVTKSELLLESGRPKDAAEEIERALSCVAGSDDETFLPEICAFGVRAVADRFDDARAHGRRLDPDKLRLRAASLANEADKAVAAPVERGGVATPHASAMAALCRAEQSRLHRPDPELWRSVARQWQDAGETYFGAYSTWREAEALLQAGAGRSRAGECLQRAWHQCDDMGATPLQERVERLAQRAGISLPTRDEPASAAPSATSDLGLTPREVEVLGQLATGRTDRQVAEALFISKKTVSVQVSSLLRKLDVANRFEAAEIGQRYGLGG
ncbi:MAG TPA: AAA family ATPase [Acidimicrobiales bacterium]|nr:AAA family ATPase [Acidimicrobiales bacterium]